MEYSQWIEHGKVFVKGVLYDFIFTILRNVNKKRYYGICFDIQTWHISKYPASNEAGKSNYNEHAR